MDTSDQTASFNVSSPPVDLIGHLQLQDTEPQNINKKAAYGIDSPTGLVSSFIFSPVYLYATLKGKHDFWSSTLAALPDEVFAGPTLDLGCGRGLVLLKVAQRKRNLQLRHAVSVMDEHDLAFGIDIFNSADQSGNSPEMLYANAKALGVLENVVAYRESFTDPLPFQDGYFSLVTASLSLHNVPLVGRKAAVTEACRVCKPGGMIIILDLLGYVAEYEGVFKRAGWKEVERRFAGFGVMFGSWPTQVMCARKPVA